MSALFYGSVSALESYLDLKERAKTVSDECMKVTAGSTLSNLVARLKNPLRMFNNSDLKVRHKEYEQDEVEGADESEFSPGLTVMEILDNGVGVLHIRGTLVEEFDWWHPIFPNEVTSYEAISDAARILAADVNVKSVVQKVSSGGGYVSGIETASTALEALRASKPLVSHTSGAAFSGAYWLGSVGKPFYASRMAQVGSIGVVAIQLSTHDMLKKMGIEQRAIRTGEFKALGQSFEEMESDSKKAERVQIEEDSRKVYDYFLGHIAAKRGLSLEAKDDWAEGRTFFSEDAIKVGLLDGVMTFEQLVEQRASLSSSTQNRGKTMKFTNEQKALLASGKPASEVLSEEELKEYNASIKAAEDKTTEDKTAVKEDLKAAEEGKDNPKVEDTKEPQNTIGAATDQGYSDLMADYRAVLKSEAKLEAKVEDMASKLQAAEALHASLKADNEALQDVAMTAVHNLQTALGKQKESPKDTTSLLETYTSLRSEMSSVFSAGQKTSNEVKDRDGANDAPTTDPRVRRMITR